MTVSESFKKKYSLSGESYSASNADRAISDLFACISRLHSEAAAAGERADTAEKQTAALTAETKALIDENRALSEENTELQNTISELQKTNARLIAEAEQLDRRLASVGVTVSANDKKLAESSERLYALVERTEQLCRALDERTAKLCRTFDEHADILCRAALTSNGASENTGSEFSKAIENNSCAPVHENDEQQPETETDIIDESEMTDAESAEAIDPTPEDISDEAMDEASDPNLFENYEASSESMPDVHHASDIGNTDEDRVINALKQALSEASGTNENSALAKDSSDMKDARSATDDEIKNMLAAMYSTTEEQNSTDNDPAPDATTEQKPEGSDGNPVESNSNTDQSKNSGYGNMKNSLDAIRRRLGK